MSRDRIVIYPGLRDRLLDHLRDLTEIARGIEGLSERGLGEGGDAEYTLIAAKHLAQAVETKARILSLVLDGGREPSQS
jgi:hypothetical protein